MVHTKERSVPCSVEGCNQRFTSPHVAKFHLRTHERERSRVACEKCEKTYLYESTLRHHILTHHDPKYVKVINNLKSYGFAEAFAINQSCHLVFRKRDELKLLEPKVQLHLLVKLN